MRTDAMDKRLHKLEIGRLGTPSYVVKLTPAEWDLPEPELGELIACRSGGRPVAVLPEVCASIDEWIARHSEHVKRTNQ